MTFQSQKARSNKISSLLKVALGILKLKTKTKALKQTQPSLYFHLLPFSGFCKPSLGVDAL